MSDVENRKRLCIFARGACGDRWTIRAIAFKFGCPLCFPCLKVKTIFAHCQIEASHPQTPPHASFLFCPSNPLSPSPPSVSVTIYINIVKKPNKIDRVCAYNWRQGTCSHDLLFQAADPIQHLKWVNHQLAFGTLGGGTWIINRVTGFVLNVFEGHSGDVTGVSLLASPPICVCQTYCDNTDGDGIVLCAVFCVVCGVRFQVVLESVPYHPSCSSRVRARKFGVKGFKAVYLQTLILSPVPGPRFQPLLASASEQHHSFDLLSAATCRRTNHKACALSCFLS